MHIGKNINELTEQSIESICNFFSKIKLSKKEKQISSQIIKEIYFPSQIIKK